MNLVLKARSMRCDSGSDPAFRACPCPWRTRTVPWPSTPKSWAMSCAPMSSGGRIRWVVVRPWLRGGYRAAAADVKSVGVRLETDAADAAHAVLTADRGQPWSEVPAPGEGRLTPQGRQRQGHRPYSRPFAAGRLLGCERTQRVAEALQQLGRGSRWCKPSKRRPEADEQLRC